MLALAVKLAFEHVTGRWPRVLGFAEREAYAAAVLLARMEEQSLEPAPVFCGDFRDLDARPLWGHCDLFAAGLPCQPYSAAGKRRGLRDERSYGKGDGPLPHALRIVSECAPALVCLENVPQWVTSGAFRRFGDSLAALGYEIEDPLFVRASDVGASHRRERVFILVHLPGERSTRLLSAGPGSEGRGASDAERAGAAVAEPHGQREHEPHGEDDPDRRSRPAWEAFERGGGAVGHAEGERWREGRAEHGLWSGREAPASAGGAVADASDLRHASGPRHGNTGHDLLPLGGLTPRREPFGRGGIFAPGPDDFGAWAPILAGAPHLAPAIESGLCVLADGVAVALDAARPDQLRCGGNGVVALQAAAAFAHLFRRLT